MRFFCCGFRGEGLRAIDRLTQVDRKTVRRYVEAAQSVGVRREGGQEQLTDEVLGQVVVAARPLRPDGLGEGWAALQARRDSIVGWLDGDVPVVKIGELLAREGAVVAERTLHRFVAEELGRGRRPGVTVRVTDGKPGEEALCGIPHRASLPGGTGGRHDVTDSAFGPDGNSRRTY